MPVKKANEGGEDPFDPKPSREAIKSAEPLPQK